MVMLAEIWKVLLELAPWMLVGMAIAGLLHVLLPAGFVHRQLRGRWGVPKAVALGVPLPLCSCGVIPAGLGLKKDGASDGASVGFLISTPQTGVDSILVSASFLGWPFALFKVASAAVTGLVGGLLADRVGGDHTADAPPPAAHHDDHHAKEHRGLRAGVDHGLEILDTIWGWLVFGVLVSAAISVFIPAGTLAGLAAWGGLAAGLAMLFISLPLYVCATASVPIAAALVAGGMPPGAAIVFLMAGPATNVATIGAIYRGFGKRILVVYLGTIIVGSLGFGLAFDFVITAGAIRTTHAHGAAPWYAIASAGILLALIAWFALRDARHLWLKLRARRARSAADQTQEVAVSGMNCGGCASKLEKELMETEGVIGADVSLEPGRVVVRGKVDPEVVRSAIRKAGFQPG